LICGCSRNAVKIRQLIYGRTVTSHSLLLDINLNLVIIGFPHSVTSVVVSGSFSRTITRYVAERKLLVSIYLLIRGRHRIVVSLHKFTVLIS